MISRSPSDSKKESRLLGILSALSLKQLACITTRLAKRERLRRSRRVLRPKPPSRQELTWLNEEHRSNRNSLLEWWQIVRNTKKPLTNQASSRLGPVGRRKLKWKSRPLKNDTKVPDLWVTFLRKWLEARGRGPPTH